MVAPCLQSDLVGEADPETVVVSDHHFLSLFKTRMRQQLFLFPTMTATSRVDGNNTLAIAPVDCLVTELKLLRCKENPAERNQ